MRVIWAWAASLLIFGCAATASEPVKHPATKPSSAATQPSAEVVLFDGKDLTKWTMRDGSPANWTIQDGVVIASKGDIITKDKYKDFDLHLEYWLPPSAKPQSLKRGDHTNSGVYLQGCYEIQILDSYGLAPLTYQDSGAIYHQKAPDVNACFPAERWETMDFHYTAPVWQNGKKIKNARVTIVQNDIKIQDDQEIKGFTAGGDHESPDMGPIRLQYHTGAVKFRNIRITPR
ncbi:MAG TPA: DUF1080 domain-containing protein [Tepidisphaeraceae bacterium]|jgi:hypothetical protein